jgi:hypothetical protein
MPGWVYELNWDEIWCCILGQMWKLCWETCESWCCIPPALQLQAIWSTLLHLLHMGKPSVVWRLQLEGTPELHGRFVWVRYCVCRRTSSRTNFANNVIWVMHWARWWGVAWTVLTMVGIMYFMTRYPRFQIITISSYIWCLVLLFVACKCL